MTPEQLAVERDRLMEGGRTLEGAERAESRYNPSFVYRVGETVKAALGPSSPDGCGPGIHFFTKRAHAEAW